MVVEVMGLLIVAGAVLVFFVRYQGRKSQQPVLDQKDMEDSTERLRQELERSGDAIIQRIGSHVDRLEHMVRETDEKEDLLARRIAELQGLRQGIQQQLAEGRLLQQRLAEQYQQNQQLYQQMSARQAAMAQQRQAVPAEVPLAWTQPPEVQRRPTEEAPPSFSQILHDSMERGAQEDPQIQDVYEPSPEARRMAQQAEDSKDAPGNAEEPGGNAANRARAFLMEGYSIEDVSRETGMGRGAIELLQQMVQHQMDEESEGGSPGNGTKTS
ncbi:MAG: hypothetical protein IKH16_07610 [Selenomonadaceae bacterium]|nr:hypothetical protein [Selenomonadaceae bacterium]